MLLVSVIIPTFNRALFVREAVESVLAQTCNEWELLVVDDGSTDETEQVLAPVRHELRYIKGSHRGVSATRNLGIQSAKGEWVAFLDSDDLWLPQKLEHQLHACQNESAAPLFFTDEIWIRNGIRVNPRTRHRKYTGWIFEHCLPLCIISPSSALMRKDLLEEMEGFDEGLPACEDYDLWLRVTLRYPVAFLDKKLIIKRGGHADQLSRIHWGLDRFRIRALWKILQDPHLRGSQREAVETELRRKCAVMIKGARRRGKSRASSLYESLMRSQALEDDNDWEAILHPLEEAGY